VTRAERGGNAPEPRAKGSALKRLKTDVQIRLIKTAYGGDLRIRSARGRSIDGTGLNGLAGNRRSGSEGAKDVLRQLIECQHCDWEKQIGDMTKDQLLQTYKNVKKHSALLSAIEQTHAIRARSTIMQARSPKPSPGRCATGACVPMASFPSPSIGLIRAMKK